MIPIPYQHWLSNLDFTLAVLMAFAFFSAGTLYGDSWATIRRSPFLLVRAAGFLLLAFGAGLASVWSSSGEANLSEVPLLVIGLLLITASFLTERLPGRPASNASPARSDPRSGSGERSDAGWPASNAEPARQPDGSHGGGRSSAGWPASHRDQEGQPAGTRSAPVAAFVPLPLIVLGSWAAVLLALASSGLVWWQSTVKLERARRGLALALLCFALAWGLAGLRATPASQHGALSILGEPFGTLWALTSLLKGAGSFFLLWWVWGYLRFRLFPQLYLTVVGVAMAISVSAAVFLSVALVQRSQEQTLDALDTNVRVFAFSLEELKAQLALVANIISSRAPLVQAVSENDPTALVAALGDPVVDFRIGAATVLNAGGEVLRTIGGNRRVGESLSEDPVVFRAFRGTIASSVRVDSGPEFPTVSVRAAAPLVSNERVVGFLLVDMPVDRAFLDRVKELTGLDVMLYGGTERAATTLRDAYGRPRVGIAGEDAPLTAAAWGESGRFRGLVTLGAEPFLASARPLLDIDQERVGILGVGLPQRTFLQSTEGALRLTHAGTIMLLLVSILPLYALSRTIARYQRV